MALRQVTKRGIKIGSIGNRQQKGKWELLEKKRITRLEMLFPSGGFKISNKQYWNAKIGSQEIPGVTGKLRIGVQNEAGQRLTDYCQENALVIANSPFQQHKRSLYTWTSPDGQHQNQTDYILSAKDGEALHNQQKLDWELTVLRS